MGGGQRSEGFPADDTEASRADSTVERGTIVLMFGSGGKSQNCRLGERSPLFTLYRFFVFGARRSPHRSVSWDSGEASSLVWPALPIMSQFCNSLEDDVGQ
jgi:hypothetical protein